MNSNQVKDELSTYADNSKAIFLPKFFKTAEGEYGFGDKFIGVTVPNCRKVAKKYINLELSEIRKLLYSPIHEERLVSLLILVAKYEVGNETIRETVYQFYLKNKSQVNNWDLVDLTSHKIVGDYLLDKSRDILFKLARSKNLWDRRISIISTFTFIRNNDFGDTFQISTILLTDKHDLIHKAVGWMLREVGKRDKSVLDEYLGKHYRTMPRTMLRYAIEKFPQIERDKYLKGTI